MTEIPDNKRPLEEDYTTLQSNNKRRRDNCLLITGKRAREDNSKGAQEQQEQDEAGPSHRTPKRPRNATADVSRASSRGDAPERTVTFIVGGEAITFTNEELLTAFAYDEPDPTVKELRTALGLVEPAFADYEPDTTADEAVPKEEEDDGSYDSLLHAQRFHAHDDTYDDADNDVDEEANSDVDNSSDSDADDSSDSDADDSSDSDADDGTNYEADDEASDDADEYADDYADDHTDAQVLAYGSQAEEEKDPESIVVIDLTSDEPSSLSHHRRDSQSTPVPRDSSSRADSFPRVALNEEQHTFQLLPTPTYLPAYERPNSASYSSPQHGDSHSTSRLSDNGHDHIQVGDDEGDDNDVSNENDDYGDPYHPWVQGQVPLTANRQGIPVPSAGLFQAATLVPNNIRGHASQNYDHHLQHQHHHTIEQQIVLHSTSVPATDNSQGHPHSYAISPVTSTRGQSQHQQRRQKDPQQHTQQQPLQDPFHVSHANIADQGSDIGDFANPVLVPDDVSIGAQADEIGASTNPVVIPDDSGESSNESRHALSALAQNRARR
ncbi:hypothetical protein DFQ26_000874, partial [Actinomortierella ambigua]